MRSQSHAYKRGAAVHRSTALIVIQRVLVAEFQGADDADAGLVRWLRRFTRRPRGINLTGVR